MVEIIEKPFWNMPNFNGYSKATLIPDFVKLDEEQMFIIDSKYYNLISGEYPGVSDITKQLLYKKFIQ